jgi:hypothetical protein
MAKQSSKSDNELTPAQREARCTMGWFIDRPNEAELKFWAEHGYTPGPIPSGWVPVRVIPASGWRDLPAGFIFGWRKIVQQPPKRLSDEEALAVLEKMGKPQIEEQVATYRSKVEAAIMALFIDSKRSLSKLDINKKLSSDYPVREVSNALDRLVHDGYLHSEQRMHNNVRQRYYKLAPTS